jgi:homospermidine synthase
MIVLNKFLLIGFGAVGQGLAPLLLQALGVPASHITALAADLDGDEVATKLGIQLLLEPLTPLNDQALLGQYLQAGDVLLNLAVEVSSNDLIAWCQALDVLYLDTSLETWPDDDRTEHLPLEHRTNHGLRQAVLALRRPDRATAVMAHGANPGLISHLAKTAIEQLAQENGLLVGDRHWASLAQPLGIQVIQVAERDTQTDGSNPGSDIFTNTWSVPEFLTELSQPCEAGLFPGAQRPNSGAQACIYWPNPRGQLTCVKSWVPSAGASTAWLVTHHEAISLAECLSLQDETGHCH